MFNVYIVEKIRVKGGRLWDGIGWNDLQRIGLNFGHVCHLALSDRIGEQHPITFGHSAFHGVLRVRE